MLKPKILEYYRSNCDRLYNEASTMIKQKRYNEAIALLYPVPKEVGGGCYEKIQRKLDEAYDGYLNKTCEKNLVRAKAEISKNNNKTALEILGSIETESNCHSSAVQLKAKIESKTKTSPQTNNNQVTSTSGNTENMDTSESTGGVTVKHQESPTSATQKPTKLEPKKTSKAQRRKKMGAIAQSEFKRTRHQGEIDRAIQEG